MEEICGYVERITFQNDENGYTVARFKQPSRQELTTIVGALPAVQPGETLRCQGTWSQHLIHGWQFEVKFHSVEAPANLEGIKKYLASGLIKGIGATYAGRIVKKFGTETLQVIDQDLKQLLTIEGIGKKRIQKIQICWENQKFIREVMIFLQQYGVSPVYAQKIFKKFGNESIQKVQDNPYVLAREIHGVGFKSADTIAQKMGIAKDSKQRIEAGIEFVLQQLSGEGHVCYPVEEFLDEAQKILEVECNPIRSLLQQLKTESRISLELLKQEIEEEENKESDKESEPNLSPSSKKSESIDFIWIKSLFVSETGIAKELKRIQLAPCNLKKIDVAKALDWVQKELNIDLASNQKSAVAQAVTEKVQIITGGPGTGKSTITNAILHITGLLTNKILLAAPTGKAAKRMSEITHKKAYTIHGLLEFDFKAGGFKKNRKTPLDCDLLIIDESSMIDTYLMYSLLKAVPEKARLIFVGDINQLPSVGPGNTLKDMIQSESLPVTMLNKIYRQAAGSKIITNAHKINEGSFPYLKNDPKSDFFFVEKQTPEEILASILSLTQHRIPKKYGFNALEDIQVLAPMKRGIIGTENLNVQLQEALNPNTETITRFGRNFKKGDKVMQIRNNYKKLVSNGDIGIILKINVVEQEMDVEIDGKIINYDFNELDELVLSYAASIHKYQGSECPCVIIPIHTTHFKLLHRNLLYTGVTRGKKLVILVGTKKAIFIAIKNDEVKKRHTGLKQWMEEL